MFSLAMLVRLGKVTEQDIKLTFAAFRKLDGHNDGVLNSRSIIAGMIQRRKSLSVMNLNQMAEVQPTTQAPMAPSLQPDAPYTPMPNSWGNSYGNWFYSSERTQPTWREDQSNEHSSLFQGQPSSYHSVGIDQARMESRDSTSE